MARNYPHQPGSPQFDGAEAYEAYLDEVTRIEPCPECGGDGGWDVPHDINRFDGSLITHWSECNYCRGSGEVEIETRPMTMEDALALDQEKLDALLADSIEPPTSDAHGNHDLQAEAVMPQSVTAKEG